ncbi:HDIG domain-containing metalloprotein [Mesoaciditoga sp.]
MRILNLKKMMLEKKRMYFYYLIIPFLLLIEGKFSLDANISWISSYILIMAANSVSFSWINNQVKLFKIHIEYFWTYMAILFLTVALFPIGYILFGVYGLPVFFGVLLVAVMMGNESAMAAAVTLSTVATVVGNGSFNVFAVYIISSVGAVFLTKKFVRRFDFSKASLWSLIITTSMLLSLEIGFYPYQIHLKDLIIGGMNPFFSMFLAVGMLPYVEYLSRIYSDMGLIELGNLSHPLLRELSMRAPGTYFHSVVLSNMCENAAQRIGANYVLGRVGPYFHDIGKIKRPEFFTENQHGINPHDSISPMMNYFVVVSHVKYGEELSKKYRLPLLVEDMIKEHHGTRMVSFFYQKALSENLNVSPDDFRYPGPKPRTKESGIVMLADSCEAAVRSLKSPTPSKIRNMIEEIVNRIYNERQLDDSGLTLKDIDQIVEEFSKVLSAMYKNRIEYPKNPKEVERVIKVAKM